MQNLDTLEVFGPDDGVAARERDVQANIFGETALAEHETLTGDDDGSLEQDPFGPTPDAGGGLSPSPERPQTRFGRYVVIERVGAGGMGEVYAAYDPELDRKVAIKLIRPGRDTEDARARLLREAQAMARLSHPNVVAVHDVGAFGRQVFIAMEFVRGETVTDWLKRAPRSWREVRDMFIQAGRGLQAAHSAGLVHRDFKPENVLVDQDGRARVTDFGLARAQEHERESSGPELSTGDESTLSSVLTSRLTHAGALLGTPGYMAPEQWSGLNADARSDQYSFSVSLYEALYGEAPFRGRDLQSLRVAVCAGPPPEPPRGGVPGWMRRLVLRGLRREPTERWESMAALLRELERDRGRVRRLAALGGLATISAVVALEVAGRAEGGCDDASAELADVWGASSRGAVRDALAGAELVYAEETAARVVELVDRYAASWTQRHAEACRAHQAGSVSSEMYDRQVSCLQRRRAGLAALVSVLSDADESVTERAVQAVDALPGLAVCVDPSALSLSIAPPEDPRDQAELARQRDLLARAGVEGSAGRAERGLDVAERALADARELGYRPLIAEALVRVGILHIDRARYEPARDALLDGWAEALASHHDDQAALASAHLVHVLGYGLTRTDEGLQWAETTRAMIERGARADRIEVHYYEGLGTLRARRGDYEQAADALRQAAELLESQLGPEHTEVARVLASLGHVLSRAGQPEEALELLTRALAIQERALGSSHPAIAVTLNNLGGVETGRGEHARAREYHERAVALRERTLGPDHPLVASSRANLGVSLFFLGELEQAERQLRLSVELREREQGELHPDLSDPVTGLGNLYFVQGRFKEAELYYRRALAIDTKSVGESHPSAATSRNNLGTALWKLGRLEEAEATLQRALKDMEAALDREHSLVAYPLLGLGGVMLEQGSYTRADEYLRRADEIASRSWPASERARVELARALLDSERGAAQAEIAARVERALERFRAGGTIYALERRRAERWLSEHPR